MAINSISGIGNISGVEYLTTPGVMADSQVAILEEESEKKSIEEKKPIEALKEMVGASKEDLVAKAEEDAKDKIELSYQKERVEVHVPAKNLEEARDLVRVMNDEALISYGTIDLSHTLKADRVAQLIS